MTDFGMCGWLKQRRRRRRRRRRQQWCWWCGAEGMGCAGPWNKSIPNGRETDGREKGGLAAECHSAPADIVLRAYMFFFVFNSNSRFILFYIIAPSRFLLARSLVDRPWREPLSRLLLYTNVVYTNALLWLKYLH